MFVSLNINTTNVLTAFAVHASTTGLVFNFNKTRTVGRKGLKFKRKIFEVINILKHECNINFKPDTAGLLAYLVGTDL